VDFDQAVLNFPPTELWPLRAAIGRNVAAVRWARVDNATTAKSSCPTAARRASSSVAGRAAATAAAVKQCDRREWPKIPPLGGASSTGGGHGRTAAAVQAPVPGDWWGGTKIDATAGR